MGRLIRNRDAACRLADDLDTPLNGPQQYTISKKGS